jgi:hypothetical protein
MPTQADMKMDTRMQGKIMMDDPVPYDQCPVCLDPIDYCQGHGEVGDYEGFLILQEEDL